MTSGGWPRCWPWSIATGITVVVANSTDSYTCNIKADMAVSRGNELDGTAKASDFWFALNVTSNVLPGRRARWRGRAASSPRASPA
jgi:hypothetical protein